MRRGLGLDLHVNYAIINYFVIKIPIVLYFSNIYISF